MIGSRLSHYELLEKIGAGGMGDVYRARDTRLDREVAIKVLPEGLSRDDSLRQRFEREARAISQLSHPHICALHDIGSDGGIEFLVMELLEGETLAARLERGPLPVGEVIRYGAQIAHALDRAHRQGVVHRDLKPANVMLTRSGVKLLDFGLAKMVEESPAAEQGLSQLATEAHQGPLTEEGTILGTFRYMAPEQLEGREADARSDIFALGVVLYEMTTGRRAFDGRSRASVIASILKEQPSPVSTVQPLTPPALENVIDRCLAKDPDDRWQSVHDVAGQLEWMSESGSAVEPAGQDAERGEGLSRPSPWLLLAALLVALALGSVWLARRQPAEPSLHAQLAAPPGTRFNFQGDFGAPPVLSPDGQWVLFGVVDSEGVQRLWLRSLASGTSRVLPGTEGAFAPFWSTDGRSIGFFADTFLKRIGLDGGSPLTLADAPVGRGGAWVGDGSIVYSPDYQAPLMVVSESGGEPWQLTTIDSERHSTHRWPVGIPPTPWVLYLAASHTRAGGGSELRVVDVTSGQDQAVVESITNAAYAARHLLYLRGGTLMARKFDPRSAEFSGPERMVVQDVLYDPTTWRGIFSAVEDRLIFSPGGGEVGTSLTWFDRSGRIVGTVGERGPYGDVDLSPDGRQLVYSGGGKADIWVRDLDRDIANRLTFDPGAERAPVFSADGRSIFYAVPAGAGSRIYRRSASGLGEPDLVHGSDDPAFVPTSVSPDGRYLLLAGGELPYLLDGDVYLLDLSSDAAPVPVVTTPEQDADGRFSPDGRWIAYASAESGQYHVYVIPFDGATAKRRGRWQISSTPGVLPRWGDDGETLYYLGADQNVYAAAVRTVGDGLQIGEVKRLFATSAVLDYSSWDVAPGGERFLVNSFDEVQSTPLDLVVGWTRMSDE